jgi:energy-coupling factor transporter ATP-binding protein EcfA2
MPLDLLSGVRVLWEVGFDLRRGEVHALMGEIGAGKSTLMKILAGVHTDFVGSIAVEGAGTSIIHQELNPVPELSVADNIPLGREPLIDNDPMVYGAYLAAKDAGREKDIKFIGIDGLPDEGVTWVNKGELAATFLYATPGAEGLRQAVKLLNGEKIEKTITLPTMKITKDNAPQILKDNGL